MFSQRRRTFIPSSTVALVILLGVLCPLQASAAHRLHSPERAAKLSDRYAVLVDGINSCSSVETGCNPLTQPALSADFGAVEKAVVTAGVSPSHFVYFSYGALAAKLAHGRYCQGWQGPKGQSECASNGNLLSVSAIPVYVGDDTHLPIDQQAAVLSWLLDQLPSSASIDIIGFSLGGVISSDWAATHNRLTGTGRRIHSVTLIDSPVGGIPGPAWFVSPACLRALGKSECQGIYSIFSDYLFGASVLDELRPDTGARLLKLLPRATKFPVTSIQSTLDYLVNGVPVPFCFTQKACSQKHVDLNLVVGTGSQTWKGIRPAADHVITSLGGSQLCFPKSKGCSDALAGPLSLVYKKKGHNPILATFTRLEQVLPTNHGKALHSRLAESWIAEAVAG
jgi:hypothetical protein